MACLGLRSGHGRDRCSQTSPTFEPTTSDTSRADGEKGAKLVKVRRSSPEQLEIVTDPPGLHFLDWLQPLGLDRRE